MSTKDGTPLPILVVDDSDLARMELVGVLKGAGYVTLEADSGRSALEIASSQDLAMLITDVHMPFMNGLELCEALRDSGKQPLPPILVISTEANAEMKARGKRAGVKGWIVKPIDLKKLVEAVRLLLAKGA